MDANGADPTVTARPRRSNRCVGALWQANCAAKLVYAPRRQGSSRQRPAAAKPPAIPATHPALVSDLPCTIARSLREGTVATVTTGMLPEAEFVFLTEGKFRAASGCLLDRSPSANASSPLFANTVGMARRGEGMKRNRSSQIVPGTTYLFAGASRCNRSRR
jgi:hypothetical protein